MQSFYKTSFSIVHITHGFKTLSFGIKRKIIHTLPKAVLRTCLWLFVFECDSQLPRGNPRFEKHTKIEEIRTAHKTGPPFAGAIPV